MSIRGPDELTTSVDAAAGEFDSALDEEIGRSMMRVEQPAVQVAGLGSIANKIMKGLQGRVAKKPYSGAETRERTEERIREESIPRLDEDETATLLDRTMDIGEEFELPPGAEVQNPLPARPGEQGEGRNINLDYVAAEKAGDWGVMLEAMQTQMPSRGVRTFDEVRAAVQDDATRIIKQAWAQRGGRATALNDTQMFAARELTMKLTDDVVGLKDKILAGTASDADKLQFAKLTAAYGSWMKWLQGSITETARGLNSMRMITGTLENPKVANIAKAMNETGMSQEAFARAELLDKWIAEADGNALEGLDGLTKLTWNHRFQTAASLWQASILTGFKTHVVNVSSNALVQMYESFLVRPVAAGIGAVRTRMPGANPERAYAYEGVSEAIGIGQSFFDALKLAGHAFTEGAKTGDWRGTPKTIGTSKVVEAEVANPPRLSEAAGVGKVLGASQVLDYYERAVKSASFGALQAEDQFFKEITYGKVIRGLAYRQATSEGLSGRARMQRMNELLTDVPEGMHKSALAEADRQTFTNRPEGGIVASLGNALTEVSVNHPNLRYIAPFIRTPTNLLLYASENSVLAPFTKRYRTEIEAGGARADTARARLALGATAFAAMFPLYEEGIITGAGPSNFSQREALQRTGWKPNSIYIDGTYYPYDRMDPFGMMVGVIADTRDAMAYAPDDPGAMEMAAMGSFMMASYALDATYMQGMSDVLDIIRKPEGIAEKGLRFGSNILAGFIPGMVKSVADVVDGDPRTRRYDPNNPSEIFWQALKNRTPWMQSKLPAKRHWDGDAVAGHSNVAVRLLSPTTPSSNIPVHFTDLDGDEVRYDTDFATLELVKNGVTVGPPPKGLTVGGVTVPLMALDNGQGHVYDKYFELLGKARRQLVEAAVGDDEYDEMEPGPRGEQYLALEQALSKARQVALPQFLDWLQGEYERAPEKYHAATQHLSEEMLETWLQDMRDGLLSPPDLKGFRGRGLPSNKGLPVPPHMRF